MTEDWAQFIPNVINRKPSAPFDITQDAAQTMIASSPASQPFCKSGRQGAEPAALVGSWHQCVGVTWRWAPGFGMT